MSGMIGIFGYNVSLSDRLFLSETINPLSLLNLKSVDLNKDFVAVSSLSGTPLQGERVYEQGNDIIFFCGDLIGVHAIPWHSILNIIKTKEYEKFKDLRGNFAIAYFNKEEKRLLIVSDRRSQQPVYYKIFDGGFVFSTEMSTFCRLQEPATFNEKWLYDYFFFNYPVSQATFLKDVFRMPPASILDYHFQDSKVSLLKYAEMFQKKQSLIEGPQSFKLALNIFRNKIPQYFEGSDDIACALTGGWDGRTILAAAPNMNSILTYTYGVPGCADLRGATETAKKANLKHYKIYFDDDFVRKLPSNMIKSIFLSSGLQTILKGALPYVFEKLTNSGKRFPLTITGIAGDGILRGHSSSPSIISYDLAKIFRDGNMNISDKSWSNVFKNDYSNFTSHINQELIYLQNTFGSFKSSEHHLLYKLYVTYPNYFGGELKIMGNFTTARTPYCDPDIINLAFSIKESSLSFSEFTHHTRGDRSELKLQSYILNELSPPLAKIPIGNTRPDIVLRNKYVYEIYRIYRGIAHRLEYVNTKVPPLEKWNYCLNAVHKEFIDDLIFSNCSLIKEYITSEFLEKIKLNRHVHWIGKLATTEILLRLIKNRWRNNI